MSSPPPPQSPPPLFTRLITQFQARSRESMARKASRHRNAWDELLDHVVYIQTNHALLFESLDPWVSVMHSLELHQILYEAERGLDYRVVAAGSAKGAVEGEGDLIKVRACYWLLWKKRLERVRGAMEGVGRERWRGRVLWRMIRDA